MRSKDPKPIEFIKFDKLGVTPSIVKLGMKHLEKGNPPPVSENGKVRSYTIPADLLNVTALSPEVTTNVDHIEFVFEK